MKRYKPIFYYLALANFLFFLGNSLYILFPVFLKNMGASESYIGIMNNVDKVFIIVGSVSIASIMHGRDRIRMLRLGYGILLVAYASYLLISSLTWLVLAIRIIHGIGFSVAMILGTTIVFDIVPMEDAAEAIGVYGITGAMSNALSPFIGEMLLARGYPHHLIFLLSVVLVGLSFGITFLLPRGDLRDPGCERTGDPRVTPPPGRPEVFSHDYRRDRIRGRVRRHRHLPAQFHPRHNRFPVLDIFHDLHRGPGYHTLHVHADREQVQTASSWSWPLSRSARAMNLCLNFLYSMAVLIAVSIMYGITHGILYPVLNATMVGLVGPGDRGKANALFTATFNGGMMLFALSLGFLIDHTGSYLSAFNFCAAAFVAALPLLWIVRTRYGGLELPANGRAGNGSTGNVKNY